MLFEIIFTFFSNIEYYDKIVNVFSNSVDKSPIHLKKAESFHVNN